MDKPRTWICTGEAEDGYPTVKCVHIEDYEALKAERDRLREALEKQKTRLREIDNALGLIGDGDLAQEIWKHAVSEVDEALAPASPRGKGKHG